MVAVAVGLLSAAILAYEVLLTRLFAIVQWHSFAFMILSVALLGFGASGTFVMLARAALLRRFVPAFTVGAALFALSAPGAFAAAQRLPFNALELAWDVRQIPYLLAVYAVLAVPFFCGATSIALALSRPGARIARIYAFDLAGAGLGALGVALALSALHPLDCLKAVAALGLLAAACAALAAGARPAPLAAAAVFAACALALPWTGRWLDLRISPYKGLSMALRVPEARIAAEASGPLGLLHVVESPRIPFRHAPGLSLAATAEPPPQLGLFTDADAMSPIAAFDGDLRPLAFLDATTAALPYALLRRPEALLLGAGGGAPILLALAHRAERVDAVELNPDVVRLVDETFGAFSGRVYTRPPVRPHVADARAFLATPGPLYDLIELPPGAAVAAAGGHGLGESYGDTVEAFEAALRRLKPGGLVAATRWVDLPPRAALKLFATAVAALERHGVAAPERRLAMIRGWQTATLIVKNGDLAPAETAALRAFAEARAFDLVHLPDLVAAEANRFNRLPEPWFFAGAQALLGPERDSFAARYKFDIRPATDDRPYAGDFFRWRALPEILALRAQGGAGLLEWGYLVLVATLVQAALLGTALILLPLAAAGARLPRRGRGRIAAYFLAVGLAFLFLEIAFIQRFTLFLGSPLHAVAVVLAGFLLFAGLGSAVAPRLARRVRRPIGVAAGAVAVVAAAYLVLLPPVFERLIALPEAARIAVALALIAPLAAPMGMPFPLGLARLDAAARPWAWAINGCASVVSAALASILAREAGFAAVVLLAAALYLAAAAAAPRRA